MAIRRLALRPEPETGYVSREAHVQAFMDLESQMWFSGGVGSIVVNRAPTDLEGEMVTVFGVLEWKDRTDAKPQAETATQLADAAPAPEQQPAQQQAADALSALAEQIGMPPDQIVAALAAHAAGENGNGTAPAPTTATAAVATENTDGARDEPEEDVSSIPEHLR